MGQDDSCGICGAHYQSCHHFRKSHLARPTREGRTICGKYTDKVITEDPVEWLMPPEFAPWDHYNKCKVCDSHAGSVGITIDNPFYKKKVDREGRLF